MVASALAALQAARQIKLYDVQITADYEESQAATAAGEAASGPASLPKPQGRHDQQLPQPVLAELHTLLPSPGLLLLEQIHPCRTALWLHRQEQPIEVYGSTPLEAASPVAPLLDVFLPWERYALATPSAFYHIARLDRFLGPEGGGDVGGNIDVQCDTQSGTQPQPASDADGDGQGSDSVLPDLPMNTSAFVKAILEDKVNQEAVLGGKLWFCRVGAPYLLLQMLWGSIRRGLLRHTPCTSPCFQQLHHLAETRLISAIAQ